MKFSLGTLGLLFNFCMLEAEMALLELTFAIYFFLCGTTASLYVFPDSTVLITQALWRVIYVPKFID